MNLLVVVTPLSIYRGCSTRKKFLVEEFSLDDFTPVNMKCFGCRNYRKHRGIKNGYNYITLGIYLKVGSMNNMKIKSSEPKYYLGISGKRLITSLDPKTISSSRKNKKARYAITSISMKDLSKLIKDFETLPYKVHVRKRSKHEPNDG